jgi:hypothetical protein
MSVKVCSLRHSEVALKDRYDRDNLFPLNIKPSCRMGPMGSSSSLGGTYDECPLESVASFVLPLRRHRDWRQSAQ